MVLTVLTGRRLGNQRPAQETKYPSRTRRSIPISFSNLTEESGIAGYQYVSREFSRIEAISAGTHGLSAAKVHNCGGFVGPESSGVGRH